MFAFLNHVCVCVIFLVVVAITSDNSLADDGVTRRNFRQYTVILYCMEHGWNGATDGGALRIYPNTLDTMAKDVVMQQQNNSRKHHNTADENNELNYVDVLPRNGRMVIFDSRLVHSVRPVTSQTKVRRALTLWILRPNDSGVQGETWDEGSD
jgi:Rps23 Pro-64 3,4-dihydroxylase Tpa1-like proline 4-hydroxylase